MQRYFPFVEGEFYHIYNRGVERRPIFQKPDDWKRFQQLLYLCNSKKPIVFKTIQGAPLEYERGETIADVFFYALMPNHFHIALGEKIDGGITKFLSKVLTAFSMYFNTTYERSGPLFCRPFRTRHVNSDEYFRWLFSYIHLNPLTLFDSKWKERGIQDMAAAKKFMQSYRYSSFDDYFIGDRLETRILAKENVPIPVADIKDLDALLRIFSDQKIQGGSLDD